MSFEVNSLPTFMQVLYSVTKSAENEVIASSIGVSFLAKA